MTGLKFRWAGIYFVLILLSLNACKNEDKRMVDDPDAVYFDYRISGREGNDKLTVLLQYRAGHDEGDALRIPQPGKVELDGRPFLQDSAGISGFYYELHMATDSFEGPHQIRLTDYRNNIYTEEFNWIEPRLIEAPLDSIGTADLVFKFSGLDSVERIRIMVTDTSYQNNEINQVYIVRNNQLVIPLSRLIGLADGPIQVEFILEKSRHLKSGNPGGGQFQVYYSMTREYWLRGN